MVVDEPALGLSGRANAGALCKPCINALQCAACCVSIYLGCAGVGVGSGAWWAVHRGCHPVNSSVQNSADRQTEMEGERGDYTQSQSDPPRVPPDTAVSSPPSILQRSSNSTSLALLKAFIYPGERLGETQTFVLKCDRDQRASGTNERATATSGFTQQTKNILKDRRSVRKLTATRGRQLCYKNICWIHALLAVGHVIFIIVLNIKLTTRVLKIFLGLTATMSCLGTNVLLKSLTV